MKVVILVISVCCILSVIAQSNNVTWGATDRFDRLIHRDIVVKKAQRFQRVTADFVYVAAGRISSIKVTDQYVNGNGGNATLTNGGVGANNVTLHLESQRSHGFNFIIEIYGK